MAVLQRANGEARRQHLHLQLRSGQLHSGKRVGAHSLHHLRNGGDFGFLERIPENRPVVQTGHPLTAHICAAQSVHKRGTHRTRSAQELHKKLCALDKNLSSGLHMSHPLLFSHLPFTSSTSSSSFTLPSTTTQEHAAQPVQHDHLQEHPVHHAHLHALPVDKQRLQESLWRENLQSGGNPRTTTPTIYKPKELATVSRIEDYPGDPYQLYDEQKNTENIITELRSPKK